MWKRFKRFLFGDLKHVTYIVVVDESQRTELTDAEIGQLLREVAKNSSDALDSFTTYHGPFGE